MCVIVFYFSIISSRSPPCCSWTWRIALRWYLKITPHDEHRNGWGSECIVSCKIRWLWSENGIPHTWQTYAFLRSFTDTKHKQFSTSPCFKLSFSKPTPFETFLADLHTKTNLLQPSGQSTDVNLYTRLLVQTHNSI